MIIILDHHDNHSYAFKHEFPEWHSDAILKLLQVMKQENFTLSLFQEDSGKEIVLFGAPEYRVKFFDHFENEEEPIFQTTRTDAVALIHCVCSYIRAHNWFED